MDVSGGGSGGRGAVVGGGWELTWLAWRENEDDVEGSLQRVHAQDGGVDLMLPRLVQERCHQAWHMSH
jgi:hypothetical protein